MHSYLNSPISTAIGKQWKQLKWNAHVHLLGLKLHEVSYLIKSLKEVMSSCIVKSIHHSKLQSLQRYGIIFFEGGWGQIMKLYPYSAMEEGYLDNVWCWYWYIL
jgi:hypothetical protein